MQRDGRDPSIYEDKSEAEAQALIAKYKKALVIDEKGTNMGVVFMADAWKEAKAKHLTLNKVKDGDVPVIRFEAKVEKKSSVKEKRDLAKNPQSEVLRDRVKEVRISDSISEHDLQVKLSKARDHLLDKYKLRVDMRFKKRADFDPVLAQMTMDNIFARLSDIATVEQLFKMSDYGNGGTMTLKPLPRRQLIAEGHVQVADPDAPKEPTRRQLSAIKRQMEALEKEELRAQGVTFKKFLTPDEQVRQASDSGDEFASLDPNKPKPKPKPKKPKRRDEDMDEDELDREEEDYEDMDEADDGFDDEELMPSMSSPVGPKKPTGPLAPTRPVVPTRR